MDQKQVQAGLLKAASKLKLLAETVSAAGDSVSLQESDKKLQNQFFEARLTNPWFTEENIRFVLKWLAKGMLASGREWQVMQPLNDLQPVAVWLRPEAPLEGAGEIIMTAFAGYRCLIRTDEKSRTLYENLLSIMEACIPALKGRFISQADVLKNFSGLISIGARPGDAVNFYLSRYPLLQFSDDYKHVITGSGTNESLRDLAEDICMFFGRSARNIKKVYVPAGYDFHALTAALSEYGGQMHHAAYFNHYEYHKASMLLAKVPHLDTGHLLITPNLQYSGRVGVLTYEYYHPGSLSGNPPGEQPAGTMPVLPAGRCRQFFMNEKVLLEFLRNLPGKRS